MTLFLAKFLGLYFLAVGIAALLNPGRFGKMYDTFRDKNNDGVVYLGGIIAIIFGALIVSVHNVWVMDWPVLITILGWWGMIKGVALIVYPGFIDWFTFMFRKSDQFYRALGAIISLIGLLLLYQGW
jgi:hypothetical protein